MLKTFWILTNAELRALFRARVSLFWIFIFPFFFLAMMMFSYGDKGALAGHTTVEVVDHDHSALSGRYIEHLRAAFAVGDPVGADVVEVDPAAPAAEGTLRVTIPAGMDASVASGKDVAIVAEYNFGGRLAAQVAAKVLTPITTRFNANLAGAPMPLKVSFANTATITPIEFPQYLLTGILIMSMMSAGMNATAVTIADHRERNTFKLMSCLPLSASAYILAILASRVIVLIMACIVLLAGARFIFGIELPLDPVRILNTAGVLMVGNLMLLSLGLALAARVASVANAIFVGNIVYLSLLFFSDLTMPLGNLPPHARDLLRTLPTSHFVTTLRATLIQGVSLQRQLNELGIMLAWCIGFLLIARLTFRWHRV